MARAKIRLDIPVDVPPEEFKTILEDKIEEAIILYKLRKNLCQANQEEAEALLEEVKQGIREKVRRLINETSS